MKNLPQYQSHKIVRAAVIALITPVPAKPPAEGDTNGASQFHDSILTLALPGTEAGTVDVTVEAAWMAKHQPQDGWYIVAYGEEGAPDYYVSATPPEPFLAGYTDIEKIQAARAEELKLAEEALAAAYVRGQTDGRNSAMAELATTAAAPPAPAGIPPMATDETHTPSMHLRFVEQDVPAGEGLTRKVKILQQKMLPVIEGARPFWKDISLETASGELKLAKA